MSTFSLPQGNGRLFLCLTAVPPPHGDSSGSHLPHSFLCLMAIHLSGRYHHRFGLTWVISSLIWPHHRAPPGGSIFYFASPPRPSGQYYLLFGPLGDIIFYFASWPCPSGDTVFYSTQRPCHSGKIFFYLAPRLRLSRKNSSYNPSGLFMSGIFCKLPWCPFLPNSSRLPFIGFGVGCLAMPCNEQPFASFLMLSIKASVHRCWCCFSCDAG
jgi:hypothetical protein